METPYKFRVFKAPLGNSRSGSPAPLAGGDGAGEEGRPPSLARVGSNDCCQQTLCWLREVSPDHLLVIEHDADSDDKRPHWHALFFSSSNAQALRVALTRRVPEAKAQYSLKEMPHSAVPAYVRYMCHGRERDDPVVLVYTSLAKYSPAFLQDQNRQFWDARAAFKKDKSKKDEDILSHCLEEAKLHGLRRIRDVAELVVNEYRARNKALYALHLRAKVYAIWYDIGGRCAKRDIIDEVLGSAVNFSEL